MILLRGLDPSPTNIWRETPLHYCTSRGHLDIMMLLLDGSALVNAADHQGLTPLHQAIIHGNRDACELLLCYGASIHSGDGVNGGVDGVEGVNTTRSPLVLASHVHVCCDVIHNQLGIYTCMYKLSFCVCSFWNGFKYNLVTWPDTLSVLCSVCQHRDTV